MRPSPRATAPRPGRRCQARHEARAGRYRFGRQAGSGRRCNAPTRNAWGSPEADSESTAAAAQAGVGQAKSSFDAGVKAARTGNLGEAKKNFDAALKADPSSLEVLYAASASSPTAKARSRRRIDFCIARCVRRPDYESAAAGIVAIYLRQGAARQGAASSFEPLADQWERNLYLQALYADLLVKLGQASTRTIDPCACGAAS